MPILLYNFPGKMGSEMGKEYLEIVSKSKNFFAIKESSGSPSKLHQLAKDFSTNSDFHVELMIKLLSFLHGELDLGFVEDLTSRQKYILLFMKLAS